MSRQHLRSASGGYESPSEDSPLSSNPRRSAARRDLADHEVAVGRTDDSDFADEDAKKPRRIVSIRDRICCIQWTWFTMVRSTPSSAARMLTNLCKTTDDGNQYLFYNPIFQNYPNAPVGHWWNRKRHLCWSVYFIVAVRGHRG